MIPFQEVEVGNTPGLRQGWTIVLLLARGAMSTLR